MLKFGVPTKQTASREPGPGVMTGRDFRASPCSLRDLLESFLQYDLCR